MKELFKSVNICRYVALLLVFYSLFLMFLSFHNKMSEVKRIKVEIEWVFYPFNLKKIQEAFPVSSQKLGIMGDGVDRFTLDSGSTR